MLKMKRCVSLLLVLCVLLVAAPVTAQATTGGSCGENVTWSISQDGMLIISGTGPMADYDVDYAPWFDDLDLVSSAKIENGVTTVGAYAFMFSDITAVEIPESVTDICQGAFSYSIQLASVEIPDSVTAIGSYAFADCSGLTYVKFYGDAPEIGENAFEDVTATAFYPSNNPTWTEDVMDDYSGSIIWVPYESSEPGIGGSCGENVTWSLSEDGVLTISGTGPMDSFYRVDVPWYDERYSISSVIIEKGVTTIGENAFSACTSLTGVEIPDSVTTIEGAAFSGCSSLTGVEIPDSVTSIGEAAFYKCDSLQGFYVDVNNPKYSNDDRGVLFNKQKTTLITAPGAISGSYTIPDSVTTIGTSAFSYCTKLTNVEIGSSVTAIDYYAFNRCSSLTSVVIGDSVSTIGESAFADCESLTSIKFYGDAPEIEYEAFYNVTATVYYPANNPTWTAAVMDNYGGHIKWVSYILNPFSDVPSDSFYEVPVIWALENGITTGATENTFDPNGSCLRAHVVTFLHRAAGNPAPTSTNNPFTDVTSGVFFYQPVLWAVENGITNGTSPTAFGAYDNCNRAAVVTFLWRAAGSPEPASTNNPFVDVKSTDFFYKAVLWAVENDITNGVDATHFGPTANCNRAQVVTFLYRTYMQ